MKLGVDILGNIVILKFDRNTKQTQKRRVAEKFMRDHKSVSTVLEKVEGFSGRLRTQKTKWVAGEKTNEALYRGPERYNANLPIRKHQKNNGLAPLIKRFCNNPR